MKINKQILLLSLGIFALIIVAVSLFYTVRTNNYNDSLPSFEDETFVEETPAPVEILQVGSEQNVCEVSFNIPCTPGLSCTSKAAFENLSSNTAGNYGFTTAIASGSEVDGNQILVYQLNYSNTGDGAVASASFTDILPTNVSYMDGQAGCSYAEASRTVTCSLQNIAAGASGSIAFRVRVIASPTAGEFVNTATLTPSSGEVTTCAIPLTIAGVTTSPSPSPSTGSANLDCLYKRVYQDDSRNRAGFYYLEQQITDTSNLQNDQTIVYSVGMKNHGTIAVSDVSITDVLAANLTYVDSDNGCSYNASNRTVTCAVGSLAGGAETARSIRVRIGVSGAVSIENVAEVASSNGQRDVCRVTVDASGRVVVEPSPSPYSAAQPTTLPQAGVFEITASTLGVGLLFLLVGMVGLFLL